MWDDPELFAPQLLGLGGTKQDFPTGVAPPALVPVQPSNQTRDKPAPPSPRPLLPERKKWGKYSMPRCLDNHFLGRVILNFNGNVMTWGGMWGEWRGGGGSQSHRLNVVGAALSSLHMVTLRPALPAIHPPHPQTPPPTTQDSQGAMILPDPIFNETFVNQVNIIFDIQIGNHLQMLTSRMWNLFSHTFW